MHAKNMNKLVHSFALIVHVLLPVTKVTMLVDVRCIERERLALMELKQGFVDFHGRLSSWGDGEHQKECCNWTGVHCSDNSNHVVLLDLHGPYYKDYVSFMPLQPLEGIVAPSLSKLDHLIYLDLSCNSFLYGTEIPKSIGSLLYLRYLNLSFSNFEGMIPQQLGNLSSLEYLDIDGNYVTANLEVVTNLTHLKLLFLSHCNLIGNIPEKIGALSQLQHLDLSGNSLTGIIPRQLGNLSQLQYLRLDSNKLHGYIPNSLWNLCHLRFLILRSNDLNGRLEDFLIDTMGITPRCLHQSLQSLILHSNQFTGPIPDISFLSKLQFLDLGDNKLNGTLSDGMGQLSNLAKLDVGSNPLQGTITEGHFSKLSKLVYLGMYNTSLSFNISKSWIPPFQLKALVLSHCKIGPYFPGWLKNQRSIQAISLHHSEIVDVLPDWFWRGNGNMTDLDLSYNKIQGEIANMPIQFSNFPYINLSANQLRGEIPPFLFQAGALNLSTNMFSGSIFPLCSMTHSSLEFLDVSRNQLSEELHANCCLHFEQLLYLDLSFNNFSGKVPASLLTLPNLHALHLHNNKFQSIPSLSSSNLTSLRSLDLSENEISGIIPSWIGDKLLNLNVISLRNNNFYGSLPFNICNLTQILVFDLSANHLSGSIPKCFNQFIALSNSSNLDVNLTYYFDSNYSVVRFRSYIDSIDITWKGGLVEYKSILRLQRVIDLSNNQLTGEIPDEIMDLVQLLSLNLSYNKLGGKIDPKIGKLQNLESLDLSRNLLHGSIPSSIAQLHFLARLDLSFNNLSGKIPTGFQLQTLNDASIYSENPELCGLPLDIMCLDDRNDDGRSNIIDQGEDENDNLFKMYEFYIFMAFGFIVGFCISCGSLIFIKSLRNTFFNWCTSVCDNVYVKVIISVNKLRRRLETY